MPKKKSYRSIKLAKRQRERQKRAKASHIQDTSISHHDGENAAEKLVAVSPVEQYEWKALDPDVLTKLKHKLSLSRSINREPSSVPKFGATCDLRCVSPGGSLRFLPSIADVMPSPLEFHSDVASQKNTVSNGSVENQSSFQLKDESSIQDACDHHTDFTGLDDDRAEQSANQKHVPSEYISPKSEVIYGWSVVECSDDKDCDDDFCDDVNSNYGSPTSNSAHRDIVDDTGGESTEDEVSEPSPNQCQSYDFVSDVVNVMNLSHETIFVNNTVPRNLIGPGEGHYSGQFDCFKILPEENAVLQDNTVVMDVRAGPHDTHIIPASFCEPPVCLAQSPDAQQVEGLTYSAKATETNCMLSTANTQSFTDGNLLNHSSSIADKLVVSRKRKKHPQKLVEYVPDESAVSSKSPVVCTKGVMNLIKSYVESKTNNGDGSEVSSRKALKSTSGKESKVLSNKCSKRTSSKKSKMTFSGELVTTFSKDLQVPCSTKVETVSKEVPKNDVTTKAGSTASKGSSPNSNSELKRTSSRADAMVPDEAFVIINKPSADVKCQTNASSKHRLTHLQKQHPTICSLLKIDGPVMPFPHSPLIRNILMTNMDVQQASTSSGGNTLLDHFAEVKEEHEDKSMSHEAYPSSLDHIAEVKDMSRLYEAYPEARVDTAEQKDDGLSNSESGKLINSSNALPCDGSENSISEISVENKIPILLSPVVAQKLQSILPEGALVKQNASSSNPVIKSLLNGPVSSAMQVVQERISEICSFDKSGFSQETNDLHNQVTNLPSHPNGSPLEESGTSPSSDSSEKSGSSDRVPEESPASEHGCGTLNRPETLADKYMSHWEPTGKYCCKFCNYSSVLSRPLYYHWLIAHRKPEELMSQCIHCPAYHRERTSVLKHIKKKHPGKLKMTRSVPAPEKSHDFEELFKETFGIAGQYLSENCAGRCKAKFIQTRTKFKLTEQGDFAAKPPKVDAAMKAEGRRKKERKKRIRISQGDTGRQLLSNTDPVSLLDSIYEVEPQSSGGVNGCSDSLPYRSMESTALVHHDAGTLQEETCLYPCPFCAEVFDDKSCIMEHVSRMHGSKVNDTAFELRGVNTGIVNMISVVSGETIVESNRNVQAVKHTVYPSTKELDKGSELLETSSSVKLKGGNISTPSSF